MKQFTLNKSIPGFLASNGINPTEVLRRAGLPDDLFSRPSTKVDAEEYYRFVEIIAGYIRNGEDFVKLATENGLEKETPQVIGALCSRNIKEAVPRMAYYADMFLPILLETQDTPEGFKIELKPWEGCDFADRVRAALLELLPSGRCKVEDVAERLHLSVRTIQRRLTEEGVKFQTILRDARVALDKGLDNLPDLKKADRAYLLGFNHIDSYRRAMAMR